MVEFVHRWLFNDFWVPVWPNLAVAAICAFHITNSNKKHSPRETKRVWGFLHVYVGEQEGPG